MMEEGTLNERIVAFDPGGEILWEVEGSEGRWPQDVEAYAHDKRAAYRATHGTDATLTIDELIMYVQHLKQGQIEGARREQEWLDRQARDAASALRWEQARAWDTHLEGLPPERAYDEWVTYRQRYDDATPEDQERMHLP